MSIVKDIARAKDLKRAGDRIDLYGDKLLLEGNATENQVTDTVDALKNSFTDKSYAIQGGVAPSDVSSFGKPIDHLFKGAGRLANSFGGFMSDNPVAMYALQGIEFAAAPGLTALRMAATELTPLGEMIAAAQNTMIDTVANKMANDGYGHEDAVNGGTGAFVMASVLGVGVAGAISRIDSVANVIAGVRNRLSQAADKAFGNLDVSQSPFERQLSTGAPMPRMTWPSNAPKIHSQYPDGTLVLEGQQPGKITGPLLDSDNRVILEPHTVLKYDANGRVYKAREYGENGVPIRDIDFTHPTFPHGKLRPDHNAPEQHLYIPNDPRNPKAGHKRGPGQPLGG